VIWVSGWDLSSRKLAWVATEGDDVRYMGVVLQERLPMATHEAYNLVDDWMWKHGPWSKFSNHTYEKAYAFVEAPVIAGARNIQSTIKQALVNGAVLAAIQEHNIECVHVAPGIWKKAVVGHGHADKIKTALWCAEYHPDLYKSIERDQDLVDAAAIFVYGQQLLRPRGILDDGREVQGTD
jgi:hypothetical protein